MVPLEPHWAEIQVPPLTSAALGGPVPLHWEHWAGRRCLMKRLTLQCWDSSQSEADSQAPLGARPEQSKD